MNHLTRVPDGKLYDANHDMRLLKLRAAAKSLCFEYNAIRPDEAERRIGLLTELLYKCDEDTVIEPPFYCDYGAHISVGAGFYANHNLVILDAAAVIIGNNVFIGPASGIYTSGHPLDAGRRNAGLEFAKPVAVGNNVWIGAGVSILPGVSIGDDAVIGAGSIVSRDIPAGTVACGNPCRVIRQITRGDPERDDF